ncbi:hypothetical protein GUJ93_ZPchr0002g26495 [Zizania palustris]|uniref:Uncharacterized protein n=1 Tax=Zizania palustris TaxID=103762 RepID=A0A8J5SBY3_ZIZPA|nr:hypothetical protein GUJ93_ZPchr0002g26495 [Zizania palustris]
MSELKKLKPTPEIRHLDVRKRPSRLYAAKIREPTDPCTTRHRVGRRCPARCGTAAGRCVSCGFPAWRGAVDCCGLRHRLHLLRVVVIVVVGDSGDDDSAARGRAAFLGGVKCHG